MEVFDKRFVGAVVETNLDMVQELFLLRWKRE